MTASAAAVDALRTEVRQRFAAVAATHGLNVRGKRDDGDGTYPGSVWEALGTGKAVGAAIPVDDGGLGLGLTGLAAVLEELAAADLGDMVPILTNMAALPLVRHGSPGLRAEILPAVASGNLRLAFAVTEQEAGSNVFAARTMAAADGDDFVLTGEKHYISGVDLAQAILILARTTRGRGRPAGRLGPDGRAVHVPGRSGQRRAPLGATRPATHEERDPVCDSPRGRPGAGPPPGGLRRIWRPAPARRTQHRTHPHSRSDSRGHALAPRRRHRARKEAPGVRRRTHRTLPGRPSIRWPETFLRFQGLRLLVEEAARTYDDGANPLEVSLPTAAARFAAVEVAESALAAAGDALGTRGFEPDVGLLDFAQMVRVFKSTPISTPVMLNFVAEHHLGLPRSS